MSTTLQDALNVCTSSFKEKRRKQAERSGHAYILVCAKHSPNQIDARVVGRASDLRREFNSGYHNTYRYAFIFKKKDFESGDLSKPSAFFNRDLRMKKMAAPFAKGKKK